jgi:serine/threonine protein kinase
VQDVVVKSQRPGSSGAAGVLDREVGTLQQLAGIPGVPRLVGVCKDANNMPGIVMQPLGKVLEWGEWSSRVTSEQPLHQLVGQLVLTLKMSHARGIINRDVRPSNVIVAGSETQQLVIIDWGFAVKCPEGSESVAAVYEGTIAYASDSVWRQYMDGSGCGEVRVSPADDLVSLVRCMFVMLHPAVQQDLRTLPRDDAQAAMGFWHRLLAIRPRWQLAVGAAARADYGMVRELLESLLE